MRIVGGDEVSHAVELQRVIDAEREGQTFFVLRDGDERQLLAVLEPDDERLTIGRVEGCDLVLDWDEKVSRLHAELERVAGGWVVADDGLSSNGTFLDGERVEGRRRLNDRAALRCGATSLLFRTSIGGSIAVTAPDAGVPVRADVTPTQRKVLVALCRPLREQGALPLPASNQAIADELVLSVDAVKAHLRALYELCGLDALPQNEKRVRLAEMALKTGIVSARELG
jgi:pSer/pThr/pTyr-binding forkhead associated (FHA) protein